MSKQKCLVRGKVTQMRQSGLTGFVSQAVQKVRLEANTRCGYEEAYLYTSDPGSYMLVFQHAVTGVGAGGVREGVAAKKIVSIVSNTTLSSAHSEVRPRWT